MAILPGDEWIFWTVMAIYLVFLALAGVKAKKQTETFEDFLVAGRKLGPVLLGLSFGVTYFSAVMIVGGAEFSYVWGLTSMWIAVIDVLVGVFGAYIVLGKRTSRMSEELQSLTLSEMLGKRYQSEKYRHFLAVITLVFEMIYLVSIFMGLSALLRYALPSIPHEISYSIAVMLCGGITIVYLNLGGAHGAIWTDVVESIIMIAGVAGIFIAGMVAIGGLDGLIATLYETGGSVSTAFISDPPALFPMKYIGYILVTSFGVWGMPQMVTRFFTVKKKRSLRWGLVISVVWAMIVSMLCWWNGAIGQALYYQYPPQITGYQGFTSPDGFADIVPALMNDLLPLALGALFVAAVAAASLTTGEKVILIASSAFVRDYYQPKTKCDDRKAMRMTKLINTIVVVVAAVIALFEVDAVLALCMFAWAALASTTLVPLVYGLFWKKATKQAALWTGIIAFIVAIVWKLAIYGFTMPSDPKNMTQYGFPFPFFDWLQYIVIQGYPAGKSFYLYHIHEFIASQVAALIAFPIISLLTQKHKDHIDPKFVDDLFVKIKQPSGVDRADAAGKMDTPPATAPPPEPAGKTN